MQVLGHPLWPHGPDSSNSRFSLPWVFPKQNLNLFLFAFLELYIPNVKRNLEVGNGKPLQESPSGEQQLSYHEQLPVLVTCWTVRGIFSDWHCGKVNKIWVQLGSWGALDSKPVCLSLALLYIHGKHQSVSTGSPRHKILSLAASSKTS